MRLQERRPNSYGRYQGWDCPAIQPEEEGSKFGWYSGVEVAPSKHLIARRYPMYLFVFHLCFRPDPLHMDPMFDTFVMNRITYSPG